MELIEKWVVVPVGADGGGEWRDQCYPGVVLCLLVCLNLSIKLCHSSPDFQPINV